MKFVVLGFIQIRDITSNPEWERAYQYEIPVLARVLSDGTEVSFNFHFCNVLVLHLGKFSI